MRFRYETQTEAEESQIKMHKMELYLETSKVNKKYGNDFDYSLVIKLNYA